MKRLGLFIITAVISLGACFTAFAGEWKQDERGWWYANGDSTYANEGWKWIDGRCYYFTPQGYCLQGTTTPDGYEVDRSGAWIINGMIQKEDGVPELADTGGGQQNHTYRIGNLQFTLPAGYYMFDQKDDIIGFFNESDEIMIAIDVEYISIEILKSHYVVVYV